MQLPVTWSINKVLALPQVGEFRNVIVRVDYVVEASEEYVGNFVDDLIGTPARTLTAKAEHFGVAQFELSPDGDFTPLERLNKAIVLGWVKDQLGALGVSHIEDSIRARVEAIKNPPQPELQPVTLL